MLLVGDGGIGKTAYLKRLLSNEFKRGYVPTLGVEVYTLRFVKKTGPFDVEVWDVAGQEKFGRMRKGYYEKASAAIIIFDLTSRATFLSAVMGWYKEIPRVPYLPRR